VVGDSIPYNHPKDCPACTGVATRYAAAIELATGREVTLTNLSEYTGLRVEGLLAELRSDAVRRKAIAAADFVLITIAHNNVVCPDWDLDREACATLAEQYRATYSMVFAEVVGLRAGRTTAYRTVNRYNDVIEPGTTQGEASGSKLILDAWNEMVCAEATANGFLCADIYHAFNGPDGLTPSGDLLASDYTHPSDLGSERIAEVLAALGYAPFWP
jgi:lysophospholipase L1-like esterase